MNNQTNLTTTSTKSSTARYFFCVINDFSDFGGVTPIDIVNEAGNKWYHANPDNYSCVVNYEIGENNKPHLHLLLHSREKIRASAVKKIFPGIHVEIARNKKNCLDYMYKQSSSPNTSQLIIEPQCFGNTSAIFEKDTSRSFLETLFKQGLGPSEIMRIHPQFVKSSSVLHNLYVNYQKETLKDGSWAPVYVEWHYGKSFSGKTFSVNQILSCIDPLSIFRVNALSQQAFDNYESQKILFIDNYDNQIEPHHFLNIISDEPCEMPVRYHTIYKQWTIVYITSLMSPKDAYSRMKKKFPYSATSLEQIVNRLDKIVFHSVENGNYIQQEIPKEDFLD